MDRKSPSSTPHDAERTATDEPSPQPPKRGAMRFRRANAPRLDSESARRQGAITRLAFHLLGREGAIEFLNSDNAELGARPLDLAIESIAGCENVEAALGRMTLRQPKEA